MGSSQVVEGMRKGELTLPSADGVIGRPSWSSAGELATSATTQAQGSELADPRNYIL